MCVLGGEVSLAAESRVRSWLLSGKEDKGEKREARPLSREGAFLSRCCWLL